MIDKRGASFRDYYNRTLQGVSLSFYTCSYLYDNIHKFDCLRPNKNLEYDITVDIPKQDYGKPQSLMFFFKQMDCKERNEIIYEQSHTQYAEPI